MATMKLNYRASALPALSVCAGYDGEVIAQKGKGEEKSAVNTGTKMHLLLSSILKGEEKSIDGLTTADVKTVYATVAKITAFVDKYAPDAAIQSEVEIVGHDGQGIADILAWSPKHKVLIVLDYKSHESLKDYSPQVKWYARTWLEQQDLMNCATKIYVGVIFGDTQTMSCEDLLPRELIHDMNHIMAKISEKSRKNIKCASAWCSQCRKRGKCKTANNQIQDFSNALQLEFENLAVEDVADRLNEATEVEKRIKELKKHTKNLLEEGEEIISKDHKFGYCLQRITCYNIDFMEAFNHFSKNQKLLEAFLQKVMITKVDVEALLQREFPDDVKARSQMLKSLLGEATESVRVKRYLV